MAAETNPTFSVPQSRSRSVCGLESWMDRRNVGKVSTWMLTRRLVWTHISRPSRSFGSMCDAQTMQGGRHVLGQGRKGLQQIQNQGPKQESEFGRPAAGEPDKCGIHCIQCGPSLSIKVGRVIIYRSFRSWKEERVLGNKI